MKMDLERWIIEKRKSLDRFYAFYVTEHEKTPENFPLKLAPGEWDEQYRAFGE